LEARHLDAFMTQIAFVWLKLGRSLIFILTNQFLALLPLAIKSLSRHEQLINSTYGMAPKLETRVLNISVPRHQIS
jgi:hypothetical protein